ncbi:MAG: LysM peptidoglycan-binding domain-containing protein [Cetobacterium sp.]
MIKNILLFSVLCSTLFAQKVELNANIINVDNEIVINISKAKNSITTIKKDEIVHVIKKGETLSKIAAKYGKKVDEIVRDNRIKNKNLIVTGNILIIK